MLKLFLLILTLRFSNADYNYQFKLNGRVRQDSLSQMTFRNVNNSTYYNKIKFSYTGFSVSQPLFNFQTVHGQFLNIFETGKADQFKCLNDFFYSQTDVCPYYYQSTYNNFDNFIKQDYQVTLIDKECTATKFENFLIFDNSYSKKDIGMFDGEDTIWQNNLNFTLTSYEDYRTQLKSIRGVFISILLVFGFAFLIQAAQYLSLRKQIQKINMRERVEGMQ